MAKLRISAGLIEAALFGQDIDVSIERASYEPVTQVVILEVSGRDVPNAAEVVAEITEEVRTERVRRTEIKALTPA